MRNPLQALPGRLSGWLSCWLPGRARVHPAPIMGKLACEPCANRGIAAEAVHFPVSEIDGQAVGMCNFCFRRWRRLNETRAIPRGKPPRKGAA